MATTPFVDSRLTVDSFLCDPGEPNSLLRGGLRPVTAGELTSSSSSESAIRMGASALLSSPLHVCFELMLTISFDISYSLPNKISSLS